MNDELKKALTKMAFENTTGFCYGCYKSAPNGRCTSCGSDDLMRLMVGVGCEYGTDWVIKELLREHLSPVDTGEIFEQFVSECYPEETTVGWMKLDTVQIMKEMDQTSWRIAESEWIDSEVSNETLISFDEGKTYYRVEEVEIFADR